jgi:hypothetical protein
MNLIGILATAGVLHSSSVLADAAGLPLMVLVAPGSTSEVLGTLQDTKQAAAAAAFKSRQQHWLLRSRQMNTHIDLTAMPGHSIAGQVNDNAAACQCHIQLGEAALSRE